MNKKVELVQSVFGITLPNFELYTSSIEVEEIQKEADGIIYPPKWKHKGGILLPKEFEDYLPNEGMTPKQAIEQLDICSSLARGGQNDSYKLYSQTIMMELIKTAVINCIYLASKNFIAWAEKNEEGENYLLKELEHEMNIFNDAFSRERPWSHYNEEEMRLRYLRLLLENNHILNKGIDMGNEDIHYNTLYENVFSNFIQRNRGGNEYITRSVSRMLQKKCYEVVEQLEKN
jgi:hypothetical protein